MLLQRYHRRDVAFKTVGVGSVGTFCAIGLFVADDGAPLLLQIKEAQASVLAPFAGASDYANHGQRVVVGQRMMQATADVFLGWTQKPVDERHFYVRRLKDARLANIGTRLEAELPSLPGRRRDHHATPAAAFADRDHETEWDPVPDTIVRLAARQTAETTPSPAEHSLSFKRGGEP